MAQKFPRFVTPKGTAKYPHLHAPDTKFDEAGVYSTKIIFTGADVDTVRNRLDQAHAESIAAAKAENTGKKIKEQAAPYTENEDGSLEINVKMKASGLRKDKTPWTQRPAVFDAKGTPLPAETKVGGGSIVKASLELMPYYTGALGAGVSLRLLGVQVIELREFGNRDASSLGFENEAGEDVAETGFGDETAGAQAATGEESDF